MLADASTSDITVGGAVYKSSMIFTGRQYDPESRIYYFRARYYSPPVGRWLSRDPLPFAEITQHPNIYNYVFNKPTVASDPFGYEFNRSKLWFCVATCKCARNTKERCPTQGPTGNTVEGVGAAYDDFEARLAAWVDAERHCGGQFFMATDCEYEYEKGRIPRKPIPVPEKTDPKMPDDRPSEPGSAPTDKPSPIKF